MARTPAGSSSVDSVHVRSNCFGIVRLLHGNTAKAVRYGPMVSLAPFSVHLPRNAVTDDRVCRYYYFLLVISALTIIFVFAVTALFYVHLLLPIIVMVSSFIMF